MVKFLQDGAFSHDHVRWVNYCCSVCSGILIVWAGWTGSPKCKPPPHRVPDKCNCGDCVLQLEMFCRHKIHQGSTATNHDGEIYPTMLNELNCTYGIGFSRLHCCGHRGLRPSWCKPNPPHETTEFYVFFMWNKIHARAWRFQGETPWS